MIGLKDKQESLPATERAFISSGEKFHVSSTGSRPDSKSIDDCKEPQGGNGSTPNNNDGDAQAAPATGFDYTYPEGGFRAWVVVVGSTFGCAVTLGIM